MVQLILHTTAVAGLWIQATVDEEKYPTGVKVTDEELAEIHVLCDNFYGEWNYTIQPRT